MEFSDQAEMIKEYLEDASDFLDRLEGLLLSLEETSGDPEMVAEVLSLLHTFKGNSGMMGYLSLQKYTHRLEDFFKAVQGGTLAFAEEIAEFAMHAMSVLRRAVGQITVESPQHPDLAREELGDLLEEKLSRGESAPAARSAPAPAREAAGELGRKSNVIRVDFERLDHLMNLMGELVIHRTRLGKVDAELKEAMGEKGISLELSSTAEQIGKISTELHEAIMRVRMLPIRQVFSRFPRLVRDLARERGREMILRFEGGETELDKTVIDEIGEPLLHLVRNAVDHGIESPEERRARGKPAQGTILLKAYQESSHIVIVAEDDGRGIDEEKLKEKAREAGITVEEGASRREILNLIFLPGVSTAREVTEVSGRGLGMDVVLKKLAKRNGTVEVESEPGIGTRFTIKLPLTLAIIAVQMALVGGEQFAIPLTAVGENRWFPASEVHEINRRLVARARDRILPLVRLGELFGLPGRQNGGDLQAVIVKVAGDELGIVVDSLLEQREVVIKALDDLLAGAWGIAGATILGDGKVVLIVDVPALFDRVRHQGNGGKTAEVKNA